MFKVMLRKELLENIQNFRFLLALVLCLIVIPLGFIVSQRDYADRRQIYDEAVRNYDLSHTTVTDVLQNGGSAFRPPAPLGLVSSGVEIVLPSAVETVGFITQHGATVQFNNTRRPDDPFTGLFGRLDLAFIVSTLLSVLVMIFTFNAIAGEKERRTIAQVMANPVSRPVFVTAKMAAGSLLLAAAFLAGVLAGILLTVALGIDPFREQGTAAPFGIAIGVSLLFLLAFHNLGLLVSSRSRSGVTAMVGLLALWVALAMVLPKGSVVAAKLLMPIRSQEVVDLEKSRVRIQNDLDVGAALEKLIRSTPGIKDMSMDEFFKAKRAANPAIDAFEKAQAEIQGQFTARLNVDLDKIDTEFERQKGRQAALARTIARLSPVSCFVHAMAELAGTGFVEEAAWRRTRADFKRLLDREIASKQAMYVFGQISYGSLNLDRKAPAPKVAAEPVPLEARLAAVWIDLALLAIYGLLFFAGAYVSFLRYDVR